MRGQKLLDWKIYYRGLAFGIMKDMQNGLLAMFQRTNGPGNGGKHAVFVNSQEVFSVEMKKYGDKTLKGIQLNMAHNADHDWLTRLGSPYILIDNLRAVSRALEPEEFM